VVQFSSTPHCLKVSPKESHHKENLQEHLSLPHNKEKSIPPLPRDTYASAVTTSAPPATWKPRVRSSPPHSHFSKLRAPHLPPTSPASHPFCPPWQAVFLTPHLSTAHEFISPPSSLRALERGGDGWRPG
jgi:hypothetical protein